jgi:hypothetical protein
MEEDKLTILRLTEALRDIIQTYPNPNSKDRTKAAIMSQIASDVLYDLGLL